MFCSKCGLSLQPEAGFCSKCGQAVSTSFVANTDSGKSNSTHAPTIWNPNAASNWSIIFSPAFGSFIHALNWRALGEADKEKVAMRWFYFSLLMLVIYVFLGVFAENQEESDIISRGLGFLYIIVWYFASGRVQAQYVKEKFGSSYTRCKWSKPLLIGVISIIGYAIFAFIFGAVVVLISV